MRPQYQTLAIVHETYAPRSTVPVSEPVKAVTNFAIAKTALISITKLSHIEDVKKKRAND